MTQKTIKKDMPKSVPTTGRTPDFLAKRYGFANIAAFIGDIPKGATVLDIGAGMSLLGHAVAKKRPDVTWINVDPYYKNSRHILAATDAPANVTYLADDITSPSDKLKKVQASRVYSYWMLPHLSVHSDGPVEAAGSAMWGLLTEDGVMRVGPDKPHYVGSLGKNPRYVLVTKKVPLDQAVKQITEAVRLPTWMRHWQSAQNSYMRPILNVFLRLLTTSQMRRARQKMG